MPKISVVIPVYGVEKYIERCARSLFEQTLDEIEFIFVDDCTPDRSMEILSQIIEEYRLRFAEMNYVVRTEKMPTNSGLPAVRRHGLQLCTGDFIIHCDSDDWIDKDMYRQLYNKAIDEQSDVVVCDYYIHDGSNGTRIKAFEAKPTTFVLKQVMYMKYSWAVWNKLVRSELYKGLKYPTGTMGEDLALIVPILYLSLKTSYINSPLYYYFYNRESVTKRKDSDSMQRSFLQFKSNTDIVLEFFAKQNDRDIYKKALNWIMYSVKTWISTTSNKRKEQWHNTYPNVEYKVLLDREINIKTKLVVLMSTIKRIF